MDSRYRVLIVGGYGTFGQRIAKALSKDARFELLIGGRSLEKAQVLCNALDDAALSRPLRVDVGNAQAFAALLAAENPALVIHTSGPFQQQDYTVARACIAAGVHYVDLADARDFVCRFSMLNDEALERGVLALAGASSVPALSSAVVDHFLPEFSKLEVIDFGINPGNQTPRGLATVSSILSYSKGWTMRGIPANVNGTSWPTMAMGRRSRAQPPCCSQKNWRAAILACAARCPASVCSRYRNS